MLVKNGGPLLVKTDSHDLRSPEDDGKQAPLSRVTSGTGRGLG